VEYERQAIPASKQEGLRSLIGMYAGEHTADTEFVIGPLFVAHGLSVSALSRGMISLDILPKPIRLVSGSNALY